MQSTVGPVPVCFSVPLSYLNRQQLCAHRFPAWLLWTELCLVHLLKVNRGHNFFLVGTKKLTKYLLALLQMWPKHESHLSHLPHNSFSAPIPHATPSPLVKSSTEVRSVQFKFPTFAPLAPACWGSVHPLLYLLLLALPRTVWTRALLVLYPLLPRSFSVSGF